MYFKTLNKDGTSCNGGTGQWKLPIRNSDGSWTPGEWMPEIEGELVPCENGYHSAKDEQVLDWFGPALYELEYRGEVINGDNKVVGRQARLLRQFGWNDRTARLFAVWCAREALSLDSHPDPRSIAACDVAERFANGEATDEELAAARDVVWAASSAAARDAASAASWASSAAVSAASWDAAWAASAARAAARQAQYRQLMKMLEA